MLGGNTIQYCLIVYEADDLTRGKPRSRCDAGVRRSHTSNVSAGRDRISGEVQTGAVLAKNGQEKVWRAPASPRLLPIARRKSIDELLLPWLFFHEGTG